MSEDTRYGESVAVGLVEALLDVADLFTQLDSFMCENPGPLTAESIKAFCYSDDCDLPSSWEADSWTQNNMDSADWDLVARGLNEELGLATPEMVTVAVSLVGYSAVGREVVIAQEQSQGYSASSIAALKEAFPGIFEMAKAELEGVGDN